MAYLRSEKENLEIDFPIEKIWEAIIGTVKALEWVIEERDDQAYKAKIKTKHGFMGYSSVLFVELRAVNEKTSRMSINVETPVTTITSVVDFGRSRDRLEMFVEALAKQLEPDKLAGKKGKTKV